MGVNSLGNFLRHHRRIALDSSIFIYQIESNKRYLTLTDQIFSWLDQPGSKAITSTITMTELLTQPYRVLDGQRVDEFYALLTTCPSLHWVAPDLEIADLAARMRALHNLRTPDAIQAATAVHGRATGLVTNDPAFNRVREIETILLDRLL